ncbi:MAG: glycosyltransferase [Gemmatimonadetes bacterium]|nr:MAG: glycosyltransferase [Gemmatimonadota bacterium]
MSPPVLVHRVIARLNVGGPAMHVVHLAAGLDPARFRTRLIAGRITADEGDMGYYARERGVEVTEIPAMSRLLSPLADLRTFLRLYRLFRRERPAIVHTHTAKAGTVGRLAALAARVPVRVHTFHGHVLGGGYFPPAKTRLFLAIERLLARVSSKLIVLSERQADEMAEGGLGVAARERFAVIPLGLELERFAAVDAAAARRRFRASLGADDTTPLVGIVGRLVPVKNHELALDALAALRAAWPGDRPPELVVVGAGEREAELRVAAADRGVGEAVHWLGWRDDLPEVLPGLDALVLTSFDEGTPVAVLEAMAARLPVVATAVGGVPEILGEGRFGRLARPGDAADVAAGLREVLQGRPPDAARLDAARDEALGRYSVARLVADMEALYTELCHGAGVAVPAGGRRGADPGGEFPSGRRPDPETPDGPPPTGAP